MRIVSLRQSKAKSARRPVRLAAALLIMFAALLSPTDPAFAHGQLQSRSAELGNSKIGAVNTVKFSWKAGRAATVRGIRLEVCTTPTYSQPCVTPAGAAFAGSALAATGGGLGAGWSYAPAAGEAHLSKSAGASLAAGQSATVTVNYFTNPRAVGTFYFRVTTYGTVAYGNEIDFGGIAVSTTRSITTAARSTERMIFRVANAVAGDCGSQFDIIDPGDPSADFVALLPGPAQQNTPSVGTAQFCISTTARNGYTIYYRDSALGGPSKGLYNGSHEFSTGTVANFISTPGSEQFGMNIRYNSLTGVGADPDADGSTGDFINTAYSTANRFSYNDTGAMVPLVAKSGPNSSARYTVSYLVNISPTTPGGYYLAHQTYIGVAHF